MKKIIINVIKGANLSTSVKNVEETCGIEFNNNSSSVFKERKLKKRTFFEENDGNDDSKLKNFTLMMNFGDIVKSYIVYIKGQIRDKKPAPTNIWVHERACFCLRVSVLRDKWHENKKKTRVRSDYVFRVHHLFILQMHLRFWRRVDFLMNKPEGDPSGFWCTYEDFYNGSFYVDNWSEDDNLAEKNDIIRDWKPTRVGRALRTLRLLRAQGALDLSLSSIRDLFYEYSNALYDRVALLAVTNVFQRMEDLNPPGRVWFRSKGAVLRESGATFGANSHRVYTKEIRRYFKAEDEEYKKLRMLEEDVENEGELMVEETAVEKARRLLPKQKKAHLDKLIQKRDDLRQIRHKMLHFEGYEDINDEQWKDLNIPTIDQSPLDAADNAELTKITTKINHLTKTIERKQKKLAAMEKRYGIEYAKEVKAAVTQNKFSNQVCEIDSEFAQDFSLLVDGIVAWQLPHNKSQFCNTSDDDFVVLHEILLERILHSVSKMNNDRFLGDCCNWILGLSVTSFEREEYRTAYSGGGVFSEMSIISALRSEIHTVLPNFPEDIEPLLIDPRNQYFVDANNYFTFWWLTQNISGISILTSIFYFDAEEEAVSLDHEDLKSPVISRLGETWVVIEEGKWTDKYGLKCIRVGESLSEALVLWLFKVSKKHWIIHDRTNGTMVSIQNSKVKDAFDKLKETKTEEMREDEEMSVT